MTDVDSAGLGPEVDRTSMDEDDRTQSPAAVSPEEAVAGVTSQADPDPSASPWVLWLVGLSLAAVVAAALQLGLRTPDRGYYVETLFVFVCAAGSLIDFAEQRIPNILTYPAILIALGLNALLPPLLTRMGLEPAVVWLGATGFRDGLLGFALCALFGIISFICRGFGGGDVKLLAATGAFLGLRQVVPTMFNWLVVAAAFGLINWAVKGSLVARLQVVAQNILGFVFTRKGFKHIYPFTKTVIPFGVFLLLGWLFTKTPISPHRWVLPNW